MDNINTQSTEQQPITPTPEASGDQGEKLFTQADLDRIVGERLARAKRDKATDDREAVLKARENRLDCREFLSDKKYPVELLDILPTADVETFKGSVEQLAGLFRRMEDDGSTITIDLAAPLTGSPNRSNPIADAFKPPKNLTF
ncbi:MAG: hypothetical protein HFE97_00065 [Oscillospiraceae bacterium]|nr:hypothetical protein [Oscillospiraceae bacterium]